MQIKAFFFSGKGCWTKGRDNVYVPAGMGPEGRALVIKTVKIIASMIIKFPWNCDKHNLQKDWVGSLKCLTKKETKDLRRNLLKGLFFSLDEHKYWKLWFQTARDQTILYSQQRLAVRLPRSSYLSFPKSKYRRKFLSLFKVAAFGGKFYA